MDCCLESLKRKQVILCGIGFQCEIILRYLLKNHINVLCLLVNRYTLRPEECYMIPSKRTKVRNSFSEVDMLMDSTVNGVPVKRIDVLSSDELESVFVYCDSIESQAVYDTISAIKNVQSFFIYKDLLDEINSSVFDGSYIAKSLWETNKTLYSELQLMQNCLKRQLKPTIFDFHFEFHLVEHCNLKCSGCTHFAPLAKEEYLSVEEFEQDISRLSYLSSRNARFINLLGGEPLLHPEVHRFFYIARKYFPYSIIRVVTNGIKLLDMSEEFWTACKDNRIIVGITEYPINIDYSAIIKFVKDKDVEFESFSGNDIPRDEMWHLSLDEEGSNRPIDNFMRCPRANACVFIKHGKIYNCATMANIEHFNSFFGTTFNLTPDDSIDIYRVNSIHEILSFLANPKPFCRYCNIDNRRYGIKWEISKFCKEEWM